MGGDTKLSVSHASYFPPSLGAPFMGAYPPIKNGQGSLYNTRNQSYFQDYRNEAISKFQMPKEDWGIMTTPYSPRADLVAANRIANLERSLVGPDCNMTYTNKARRKQVDNFYQVCQKHRETYKDHSGQLHPLNYFRPQEIPFQCPSDLTGSYFKHPQYYVAYKKPPTLPLTLNRTHMMPNLPERCLVGHYD